MTVSIIIPTYNEAQTIGKLLQSLGPQLDPHDDLWIVDGGSTDLTEQVIKQVVNSHAKIHYLQSPQRGRGHQLRYGADHAFGDVFWFLHADTMVPLGALATLKKQMESAPELVGGHFALRFDHECLDGQEAFIRWLNRFYEGLGCLGLYYGDSGIFCRRKTYETLGGFKPIRIMEDFDFVRRLGKYGKTLQIREPILTTSARKFKGHSSLAIIGLWLRMHAQYAMGCSNQQLADFYERF